MSPEFSVVIPTRNRLALLKKCVQSLMRQSLSPRDYEIIIVNDASTDGTSEFLTSLQKYNIIVITNQSREGHAISRNKGFARASGTYIASTDDDCEVSADWLRDFRTHFLLNPVLAAVGGSVAIDLNNRYSCAGAFMHFSNWFSEGKVRYVKNIPSCNIAYRKKFINELKFDEDSIEIAYRDTLFNYELIKAGHKILFDPRIVVIHHEYTPTLLSFVRKQRKYGIGFSRRGYRFHGLLGHLIHQYPALEYTYYRLFLIFMRSLRSVHTLKRFISHFTIITLGETFRIRYVVKAVGTS